METNYTPDFLQMLYLTVLAVVNTRYSKKASIPKAICDLKT